MRQLIMDCADWPKFDTLDNGKRRKFLGISEVYVAKLILNKLQFQFSGKVAGQTFLNS